MGGHFLSQLWLVGEEGKSVIEYVILAEPHRSDFGRQYDCPWRTQRATFWKDLGVLAPVNHRKSDILFGLQGMWG